MIKAIIVDDESHARGILSKHLEKYFNDTVSIVGEASNASTAEELVQKAKPDVVFLDIKMPGENGFDFLNRLDTINFEVVFTTAFDQYALKAFQFSAFGYLLKPIKISELKQIIQRLQNHLFLLKAEADKRMKVLIENYGDDHNIKKLVIKNMSGFTVLNIEDIIMLQADQSYTDFILKNNKKITASKKIGDYENLLSEIGFHRVHHGSIINLRHVVKYIKGDGGTIEMIEGHHANLSRNRKSGFLQRFVA